MKIGNSIVESQQPLSGQQFAARVEQLAESDPLIRAALPSRVVNAAKSDPGLGLAQLIAVCMEGYADRPALAHRATELSTDPSSGRTARHLLRHFEMISYRELWTCARSLAAAWYHDAERRLAANDFICVLAFTGVEFVAADLAAFHNGAVVVPMQTTAPLQQLLGIFNEVEPNWLATSLECLDVAVEIVVSGQHRPKGILLLDCHLEADDEREIFEAAQNKLRSVGMPDLIFTLQVMCARGQMLPPAPIFAEPDTAGRLCAIYYTSGSTGLPKGAMLAERTVSPILRATLPVPVLSMSYMPLNHAFGRGTLLATIGAGGICYFTAKSDLSELFDDIRVVRPTMLSLVPRVCEMIYKHYQIELERQQSYSKGAIDFEAIGQALILDIRNNFLGGRVLISNVASAPLAPDLRQFIEACLGFPLDENYGSTESTNMARNKRIQRPPIVDYKLEDVPELGYFKTDRPYPRGELLVKSQNIMLGYYKRPEVTAQVFDVDGYYKTGDIMAEIAPDHLTYVDRRNNVLKLAQGEFVAIALLEALYTNGHPAIQQAFLYGTSERSFLLGVLVPNEKVLKHLGIENDDRSIKAVLRDAVKEVARAEQLHAYEVPRDFIVEHEPFSTKNGLLGGVGKYQRTELKGRYAARLEELYSEIATSQAEELQILRLTGRTAPVLETVGRAVKATLGIDNLDLATPCTFTQLGGDSLSALSCSLLLEEVYEIEIPAPVINNPSSTLQQLAEYIERARVHRRVGCASVHGRGATEIHASDLTLDKFLDTEALESARQAAPPSTEIRTVLMTGANGYLGRFLCLEWLERMAAVGGRVICIARGQTSAAARQRVADVFDSGDLELKQHFEQLAQCHLEVLAGDIGEPELGLSRVDWQRLAETVDLIVHPAAFVNHLLPYSQLYGANVVGTAELIRLALTHHQKPFNNVSTVAVAIVSSNCVLDEDADVRIATPIRFLNDGYANGYANSKWAGEVLLRDAHARFGLPVAVFRSDMILAHSQFKGQLNIPDSFTRWLYSIVATGLAPCSFYTPSLAQPHYDGLPVDFSAKAIAVLGGSVLNGYRTYHVVNPHNDSISLDRFVDWIIEAGYAIHRIDDYADWRARFETALRNLPDKQRQRSMLPLLSRFDQPMPAESGLWVPAPRFQADVSKHKVGVHGDIPHLSESFIRKCLADLRHLNFI